MLKVENKRGTADRTCSCGNWLRHWERSLGNTASVCGAADCGGWAEVGAHIMVEDAIIPSEFILPLCAKCSRREDVFETTERVAPAGAQPFCG
jgi:hypothetical protein